jgi:hypothetical protein
LTQNRLILNRAEKRSQRNYNLGFKLAVISQVEKDKLTNRQVQKKYRIQSRSTVLVYLRKFGTLD